MAASITEWVVPGSERLADKDQRILAAIRNLLIEKRRSNWRTFLRILCFAAMTVGVGLYLAYLLWRNGIEFGRPTGNGFVPIADLRSGVMFGMAFCSSWGVFIFAKQLRSELTSLTALYAAFYHAHSAQSPSPEQNSSPTTDLPKIPR